jgi:predicted dehydrogenase
LHYPDESRPLAEPPDATRITIRGHRVPAGRPLNYALVGVGAFGTSMLVPQIAKRPDALFLRAVVSRNTTLGGNFARAQQAEVFATEIGDVLRDGAIDAVVIATRHDRHARQAAEALRAGKHVFVEKPLALTWPELESVSSAASEASAATLMVGFNRRFSPAIQRVAAELADRRTPIMVTYRLNGGYIPRGHWIQTAEGGGRNLGEACHMYDVFRFLARSPVATIQAAAIDPAPSSPHLRTDNFSATLTYQDGSVAQLLYTALGPKKGLAKERIEVFADSDALVVDDFCRVTRASTGDVLWQSDAPDKGHEAEIARWADGLAAGSPAPIPLDELLETSAVALTIEDLLAGRDAPGH